VEQAVRTCQPEEGHEAERGGNQHSWEVGPLALAVHTDSAEVLRWEVEAFPATAHMAVVPVEDILGSLEGVVESQAEERPQAAAGRVGSHSFGSAVPTAAAAGEDNQAAVAAFQDTRTVHDAEALCTRVRAQQKQSLLCKESKKSLSTQMQHGSCFFPLSLSL
jgi:hypothetical protein